MFTLSERVDRCLYFQLQDLPEKMLRVDFLERSVTMVSEVKEPNYYAINRTFLADNARS